MIKPAWHGETPERLPLPQASCGPEQDGGRYMQSPLSCGDTGLHWEKVEGAVTSAILSPRLGDLERMPLIQPIKNNQTDPQAGATRTWIISHEEPWKFSQETFQVVI